MIVWIFLCESRSLPGSLQRKPHSVYAEWGFLLPENYQNIYFLAVRPLSSII